MRALWRRQRNLLLPVFSRERLPEYRPIITRHRMMAAWKDDSIHDIYRDMMRRSEDHPGHSRRHHSQSRAEIATGATGAKDLLALLLKAQQSRVPISDELIRDEATTFLLGGHETTAIALAWVWHLVTQHPDVEERLAKQLDVELCRHSPRFGTCHV